MIIRSQRRIVAAVGGWWLLLLQVVTAFQTRNIVGYYNYNTRTANPTNTNVPPHSLVDPSRKRDYASGGGSSSSTALNMFMGSDGGLLGIGTPELFTILLVGYFVLGPNELYKLVKEIGNFVSNIRTLGTDITTQFQGNMESQLQLDELRKAQRELNDAFSFRRTINVDKESEAFEVNVDSPRPGAEAVGAVAVAAEAETETKKKKIRRRRIVRKQEEEEQDAGAVPLNGGSIPDLEMPAPTPSSGMKTEAGSYSKAELDLIEDEFDKYTGGADWFSGGDVSESAPKINPVLATNSPPQQDLVAQSRFQQQLSGTWNEQILQNEDKLSPIATVMNKIALLEKEKIAATARLEEEFKKRAEIEETYYREQRRVLEEAAREITDAAVGLDK